MDSFVEFQRMFEGQCWMALVIARDGAVLAANPPARALLARERCSSNLLECLSVDGQATLRAALAGTDHAKPTAFALTFSPGPRAQHVEFSASAWNVADGSALLLGHDVTAIQQRAELTTRHLDRTYRVLTRINQLLIGNRDEAALCRGACDIAVDAGGFLLAWLGYADSACANIDIQAVAGMPPEDIPLLRKLLSPPEPECVFTCDAVRLGRVECCNDVAGDPRSAPWRAAALERGYLSMVSLPLKSDDRVIGAFNLYSGQRHYFDQEELRLLDRLARDIGFGIDVCRREAQTRQLQEQLRQAQKMEAIGQLAGGVAHDFNNIIAVVRLQTDLLSMDPRLPGAQRDGLQQIREAAERATDLTRQLLLFSRGQLLRPAPIAVNDRIVDLTRMLQRMIGEAVELRLQLMPDELTIEADPSMFDQMVLNIAINARDAMPRGGRLTIATDRCVVTTPETTALGELAAGRYVRIELTDTGSGIPPEVLPHVFEPFFTTKPPGKGTGFGLATVFGVVKQHRGAIQIRTQVGHGTTFTILLPLVENSPPRTDAAQARPAQGGSEGILMVEDEPSVRLVTRAILERYGYTIFEAADGVQALAVWSANAAKVALLVTDVVMPGGLSGQDLARRLRVDRPGLQVIFTSGYNEEFSGDALELGPGEVFLQKPFPPDVLLNAVRKCLDRQSP